MDLGAAFKSEIFRPLTTIAVPGFIAVAPYVPIAGYYIPQVPKFWNDHDGAFVSIFVVCTLAVGLILESVGALFETRILDGRLGRENADHQRDWDLYLQLRLKDEMIGQRYLRSLLIHLKFELSMIPAFVSLWAGLLWIDVVYHTWTAKSFVTLTLFICAVIAYLVWESFQSAKALAKTRRLILAGAQQASAS